MKIRIEIDDEGTANINLKATRPDMLMAATEPEDIAALFDGIKDWYIDNCSELYHDEDSLPESIILYKKFYKTQEMHDEEEEKQASAEVREERKTVLPDYLKDVLDGMEE